MGMSYRNFIQSGLFKTLEKDFDITYLTVANSAIEKLLVERGLTVSYLHRVFFNKVFARFLSPFELIQYYVFYMRSQTETMHKYIKRDKKNKNFYFFWWIAKALNYVFKDFSKVQKLYKYFISRRQRKNLRDYDQILLLSTDNVFDKALLVGAKGKIKTSVIVHSWDNLPARGFLATKPDNIMVWNDIMVEQVKSLHGIEKSSCTVIGVPQYHYYKEFANQVTFESFIGSYGIPLGEKVIAYTCSAQRVFPDEEEFIEELIEFTHKHNHYLIIRLHPTERQYYVEKFSNRAKLILDIPPGQFAATITNNVKDSDEDILKFIALMKYSNVVVNLASTISLDAMLFNTPVVCPAYNPRNEFSGAWNNAKDWYNSSHFNIITKMNAVKLASSKQELFKSLNNYLENPRLDEMERKTIMEILAPVDIDTPERISIGVKL